VRDRRWQASPREYLASSEFVARQNVRAVVFSSEQQFFIRGIAVQHGVLFNASRH